MLIMDEKSFLIFLMSMKVEPFWSFKWIGMWSTLYSLHGTNMESAHPSSVILKVVGHTYTNTPRTYIEWLNESIFLVYRESGHKYLARFASRLITKVNPKLAKLESLSQPTIFSLSHHNIERIRCRMKFVSVKREEKIQNSMGLCNADRTETLTNV